MAHYSRPGDGLLAMDEEGGERYKYTIIMVEVQVLGKGSDGSRKLYMDDSRKVQSAAENRWGG